LTKNEKKNITASILQRLKNYSQAQREDHGLTLSNYAIERFLYRLSISKYTEEFVLKGAQLFRIWTDKSYRPTRDLDLLRFGSPDIAGLVKIFQAVCNVETEVEDGVVYLEESVRAEVIREENEYDGIRIKLEFKIGRAGQFMQVDIGFGDSVSPPATKIQFPTILEMPSPNLKAYTRDTVVAEKVEAMIILGYANSRMKDFYDVYKLSKEFDFEWNTLKKSIQLTFKKRRTAIPNELPLAFTEEFSGDSIKQTQWNAFLRKNSLVSISFPQAIEGIKTFVEPIFMAISNSNDNNYIWSSRKGWVT
jgi:predicted nucleotidyltransferase component of viral defense system